MKFQALKQHDTEFGFVNISVHMIQSSFYLCENSHYGKKLDISYHKFNDLKKTQSSIKKNILKYLKISKHLYMVQIGSQKYIKMFECLN